MTNSIENQLIKPQGICGASPLFDLIDATEWNYDHLLRNPHLTSTEFLRFAERMKELILSDALINWSTQYHEPIPSIPFDQPIIVGGTWLELCVPSRAQGLKRLGYTNITVSEEHSASLRKHREFHLKQSISIR